MKNFNEIIKGNCLKKNNRLCIGLDLDNNKLSNNSIEYMEKFIYDIIESTIDHCPIYKINFAFYEKHGSKGYKILEKIPEVINIELKQNGIVKVALDEQFVPQVKKYFEQWASEKLNGAGRADDSNVDTSMHNTDNGGG